MKTYNVMAENATNGWTWLGTVEASCERQAMAEALDMVARSKQTVPAVLSIEVEEVDPEVLAEVVQQLKSYGVKNGLKPFELPARSVLPHSI